MVIAKPFDPGFSTADAEHPSLKFAEGQLELTFRDWCAVNIHVVFRGVWRFEWLDEVPDGDEITGERRDGTSVIHDSSWIPVTATEACKHFRLHFNECCGRLDVACESFVVTSSSEASS